ncbi:MAG TPA: hypothetical protein V6D47_04690 [Oscillatoriaceae cyanobacterium]
MRRWYSAFVIGGLMAGLSLPARASGDPYPVRAEVRLFARQAASPAALTRIADDFATRHERIQEAGGKALARTDVGYGARFRVRYLLKDAVVETYSGIFDGALSTCHFNHAWRLTQAVALARALQGKDHDTAIDFNHPTSRTASEVRYELDQGCVADCIFRLDKAGACTEILWSSAC